MKQKRIPAFLIIIFILLGTPLTLLSQNNRTELDKWLQSNPELRGKIPSVKTPAEPKRPLTTPALLSVPEREKAVLLTMESLLRDKGVLPPEEMKVFGHQLFVAGPTSFTPPASMPVTADYVVGPEDTIVVNIWGRLNQTHNLVVERNGIVHIPQVGSVQVAGLTYKQLVANLRKEVESVLGASASVSMGELRSITVFVVGAVKQPGAYTVSAFDTILNALIYAGGPEVKSQIEEWFRARLKEENTDLRQLVEPSMTAKNPQQSQIMMLLAILKEERQSEEMLKRVRDLDGEQLQKEVDNLELTEDKKGKYANLRQIIERIKTEKELGERKKDYESLRVDQLEGELRKLDSMTQRQERDYTLRQHVYPEKGYKGAVRTDKDMLLPLQLGSMRNIQLRRNDKLVSTFDLYDLILRGDKSKDRRLQQGDVIFVPKPETTAAIHGEVKVPALYELQRDRSLIKAIELAGGLNTSAYGGQIQVQRYEKNRQRIVLDISLDALKTRKNLFLLQDGDRVNVFSVIKEDVNVVYLFGNAKRTGKFQLQSSMRVSDVLTEQGLLPETDLSYAFIKRYKKPSMEPSIVPFKLGEAIIQKMPQEDMELQPYDEIYVFQQWDFQVRPIITISGEVRNPGKYPL
ncbi:MAG: SLBB domain-containing protein, partial [Smithellaceae bacterium]|nr:SLBB domain-containing protein [Smithellaceae bacterium]